MSTEKIPSPNQPKELLKYLIKVNFTLAEERLIGSKSYRLSAQTVAYDNTGYGINMPIDDSSYYHNSHAGRMILFKKFGLWVAKENVDFRPFVIFLVSEDHYKEPETLRQVLITTYMTTLEDTETFYQQIVRVRRGRIKNLTDPVVGESAGVHKTCLQTFYEYWEKGRPADAVHICSPQCKDYGKH